jgi:hypothetical protein
MWVWAHETAPPDPAAVAAFAAQQRISEAFVSVPWGGPTAITHQCVAALRGKGVRVSALGGAPSWTVKDVAARTALPVEVDLSPWLADAHPAAFAGIVRRAGSVSLMAYRDRRRRPRRAGAGARFGRLGARRRPLVRWRRDPRLRALERPRRPS